MGTSSRRLVVLFVAIASCSGRPLEQPRPSLCLPYFDPDVLAWRSPPGCWPPPVPPSDRAGYNPKG